eukprot:gene25788-31143_t
MAYLLQPRCHIYIVQIAIQEAALAAYGVKVLGSYVGTDQYIQRNLLEQVATLPPVLCYQALLIYRTIPPHLSHAVYGPFEEIKRKILANILVFPKREHRKKISYRQAQLCIPEGGLGLKDERGIAMSAYCASVLMWANSQPQTLESFLLSPNAVGDLRPRPDLPVHLVDFTTYLEAPQAMWMRSRADVKPDTHPYHQGEEKTAPIALKTLPSFPLYLITSLISVCDRQAQ